MWTVEKVKEELPKVKIMVNGKIVTGNVAGRKNKFAGVWTKDNHEGWEFSWQTITRALNEDRVLKI